MNADTHSRIRSGRQCLYESFLRNVVRYIVVFSIILAVSYVQNLRPPQPFRNENASNILRLSTWQKLFISFNGFAFLVSACGLLLCASLTFSPFILASTYSSSSTETETALQLKHLATALPEVVYVAMFLVLSLTCCSAAYLLGGLATVEETRSGRLPLVISFAIGGFVYLQALYIFLRALFRFWSGVRLRDMQLWEAMKAETVFGRVWCWYVETMFERSFGTSETKPQSCEKSECQGK